MSPARGVISSSSIQMPFGLKQSSIRRSTPHSMPPIKFTALAYMNAAEMHVQQ